MSQVFMDSPLYKESPAHTIEKNQYKYMSSVIFNEVFNLLDPGLEWGVGLPHSLKVSFDARDTILCGHYWRDKHIF